MLEDEVCVGVVVVGGREEIVLVMLPLGKVVVGIELTGVEVRFLLGNTPVVDVILPVVVVGIGVLVPVDVMLRVAVDVIRVGDGLAVVVTLRVVDDVIWLRVDDMLGEICDEVLVTTGVIHTENVEHSCVVNWHTVLVTHVCEGAISLDAGFTGA